MSVDIAELPEELQEEYGQAMLAMENYTADYGIVEATLLQMEEEGVSRAMMIALEAIDDSMINPDYPIASYTLEPSDINLDVALESIVGTVFKGLWSVVTGILDVMIKILDWIIGGIARLFGIGSGDSGAGGGSSTSKKSKSSKVKSLADVQPMAPAPEEVPKPEPAKEFIVPKEALKIEKTLKKLVEEFNHTLQSADTYSKLKEMRTKTISETNFNAGLQSVVTAAKDIETALDIALDDIKMIDKNILSGEHLSDDIRKVVTDLRKGLSVIHSLNGKKGISAFFNVYGLRYPAKFVNEDEDFKSTVGSFIETTRLAFTELDETSKQFSKTKDDPKQNTQWWADQTVEQKLTDPDGFLKEVIDLYKLVKNKLEGLRKEFKKVNKKPVTVKNQAEEELKRLGLRNGRGNSVALYREAITLSTRALEVQITGLNKTVISAGRWYSQWNRYAKEQQRLFDYFIGLITKREELSARYHKIMNDAKGKPDVSNDPGKVVIGTVVDGEDVVISSESNYDASHRLGKYYS